MTARSTIRICVMMLAPLRAAVQSAAPVVQASDYYESGAV